MKIKYWITFTLLFVCIIGCGIDAMAMESGFDTEDLTSEDYERIKSVLGVELITDEPQAASISSFDVSDEGLIALGISSISSKKMICIYDGTGEFQYGYIFNEAGSFLVEFCGNNLNVYTARGNIIFSIGQSGIIEDVKLVKDTRENNLYKYDLKTTTKTRGDTTYIIRNDLGAFRNFIATDYSQVVLSNGEEEIIIYDVNSIQRTKQTVMLYFVFGMFMICGVACIVEWIKASYKYHKKKKTNGKNARWHFD